MDLFLGIDGGGTGCRAVLADAAGRRLGHGMAGPANIASDFAGAVGNILSASEQACAAVGADPARVVAGLGLAGANAAGLSDRLAAALPFARMAVETDGLAAVRGALAGGDGIVAALGTGSAFARQEAGRIRQVGGWGLVLGDEGSGAWIGRAILSAALRAVDGFTPISPLLSTLIDEMGGTGGVVTFSLSARPADFARLAPRVAESDDPAAQAVMARAAADVAAVIDLLQAGGRNGPLPVVFLGGLGAVHAARLAGRWPMAAPKGNALDGALALALTLGDRVEGA